MHEFIIVADTLIAHIKTPRGLSLSCSQQHTSARVHDEQLVENMKILNATLLFFSNIWLSKTLHFCYFDLPTSAIDISLTSNQLWRFFMYLAWLSGNSNVDSNSSVSSLVQIVNFI